MIGRNYLHEPNINLVSLIESKIRTKKKRTKINKKKKIKRGERMKLLIYKDINTKDEEGISPLVEALQQEKKQLLARLQDSDERQQVLEADNDARDARVTKERY